MEQADAALEQRKAEVIDLRGQIESQIRNSYLDLEAAASRDLELAKASPTCSRSILALRLTQEKFDSGSCYFG